KWFEKFYWFVSSEGYLVLGYVSSPADFSNLSVLSSILTFPLSHILSTNCRRFTSLLLWSLSSPALFRLPCSRRSEGRMGLTDSARDGQQTELLIRRYFRKGDIYVHSDIQGSSVVIIKNPSETGVIPPGTLSQAGIMAIATSRAWEVKQGISPRSPRSPLSPLSPPMPYNYHERDFPNLASPTQTSRNLRNLFLSELSFSENPLSSL